MRIVQFYDEGLAHASYAIFSKNEIALIDPSRDPKQYYDFASKNNGKITTVIETHPHADFVSSHLEIHKTTGATIYASRLVGAGYPHKTFDNNDIIKLGEVELSAINTPGHSPDSITILLKDANGNQHSIFTGDTIFIGDVGRPDLRENVGNIQKKRQDLANDMFDSINKIKKLDSLIDVYPAHGSGSLCGKSLSDKLSDSLKNQMESNYAFVINDRNKFVEVLLEDQPYIPKYFTYNVDVNKKGAPNLEESLSKVPIIDRNSTLNKEYLIIDTRIESEFKKGHIPSSINLQNGGKFETWLGSIVAPNEKFYLIADNEENLREVIYKTSKIGYEVFIAGALLTPDNLTEKNYFLDYDKFLENSDDYNIIDIRNNGEVDLNTPFSKSINIPLHQLREKVNELPVDKPLVIHCAAGYRSACGCSIVHNALADKIQVFDFGEKIKMHFS